MPKINIVEISSLGKNIALNASCGGKNQMKIIANFDASVDSAPAGYKSAISNACNFFDSLFSNSVTVNITFAWASLSGNAVAETSSYFQNVSYNAIRNALAEHDANTPGLSSVALPTSDPFSGNYEYAPAGEFFTTNAQYRALGLGSTTGSDGQITLNSGLRYNFNDPQVSSVAGAYDAVATLEHEISELLGRQCGSDGSLTPSAEALLRYTSRGAIDTSSSYANAYLSLDGGTTNAGPGHVGESGGDLADWSGDVSGDAFGYGYEGTAETVSAADIALMTALGWTRTASSDPGISGTHGTTTTSEAAVTPFSGVTLTDADAGATDTLTIALSGPGGSLSGAGLTQNPDGTYALAPASAATVTAELEALRFTPAVGAPGTSSTTRFTLADASSAGTSATDGATAVTDLSAALLAEPQTPSPLPQAPPTATNAGGDASPPADGTSQVPTAGPKVTPAVALRVLQSQASSLMLGPQVHAAETESLTALARAIGRGAATVSDAIATAFARVERAQHADVDRAFLAGLAYGGDGGTRYQIGLNINNIHPGTITNGVTYIAAVTGDEMGAHLHSRRFYS